MVNDGLVNFLDFLAESQSRTVKALAKEFGDLVVYCRSQKFHVDDDKAKRIAAILNSSLFENKVDVPVVCASLAQINSNRQSDSAEFDLLSNQFFALTSSLYDFNVDGMHVEKLSQYRSQIPFNKLKDVEVCFRFSKIFLNTDELKHSNFIFCVNSLCHEMIHQYDHEHGEYPVMLKAASYYDANYDSHQSPTFQLKKQEAMKEHLKVIEDGEGKDYDKLNDEAFNFMMQIDENDDRKLDVFKDEEDGKWHVDMRQFKGSKGLKVVSKRYCELDHFV